MFGNRAAGDFDIGKQQRRNRLMWVNGGGIGLLCLLYVIHPFSAAIFQGYFLTTLCYGDSFYVQQGKYVELSVAQRTDVWRRWKAGESLHTIGRAFDRPHTSIHCPLSHHGGIVPAVRRRSVLALTVVEREDISRGSLPVRRFVILPKI
jgi:hypothetical protein